MTEIPIRRRPTEAALELIALEGIRALLQLVGEDPDRPGLADTPGRVIKAYRELCARPGDPDIDLGKTFPDVGAYRGVVAVGPIPFTSLCEHHLLPFTGTAHVGYIPAEGRVVGLSKIPRTVAHYAGRPQVQERLTNQIAYALASRLEPDGVAVVIRGHHTCMSLRGACATGAMETSDLRGDLATGHLRAEFMATVNRNQ